MTTDPSHREFRAGAGRLCLDFIRTLRYRGQPRAEEELATAADLATWVARFGPCRPTGAAEAGDRLAPARELREAINVLVTTAVRTRDAACCPAGERSIVNAAAARPVPAPHITDDGGLIYRAPEPVAATLAMVARDALDLVTTPDILRVRTCANPDCQILFLDHSRPGTRRWCSMRTCGNQAKKAKQRERDRITRSPND